MLARYIYKYWTADEYFDRCHSDEDSKPLVMFSTPVSASARCQSDSTAVTKVTRFILPDLNTSHNIVSSFAILQHTPGILFILLFS